ncbi:MAG: hypothetical protein WEE67_04340 [Chloroflexota bacterium]
MPAGLRNLLTDARFWLTAAAAILLALVLLGLLSGIIANPLVVRTVRTRPIDIAVWLASAPLIGLTLATYVVRPHHVDHRDRGHLRVGAGSLAVYFAIACPACNKLILLALGFSGALNVFAPIQPIIGVASLAFLAGTLTYRLRQIGRGCERCVSDPAEALH